jgi:hypothetical protein
MSHEPKHFIGGKLTTGVRPAKSAKPKQDPLIEFIPGPQGPRGEPGPKPSAEELKILIREVIREMRLDVPHPSPKAELDINELMKLI